MYKMIATDLDGTLLQNGNRIIPDYMYDLIKAYVKRGGIFLPASGRQYANLKRMFAPVAESIAYIAENGCLSFYKGELIHKESMERSFGLKLIREAEQIDGCEIVVSGVECNYIKPKDKAFYDYMLNFVKTNTVKIDDLADVPEDYFKISVYSPQGTANFEFQLKERFGSVLNVVTSGNCWLDAMPKNVHKGSAIKVIAKKAGIPLSEVVAIGDHYNDYEILSAVGHPMCVENAKPEIKAMCERCEISGEELLAELLQQ